MLHRPNEPEQAARTRPSNQTKMLAKKDKDPVFDQFTYEKSMDIWRATLT